LPLWGEVKKMNKEKAVELIQAVKKGLSRTQIEAMISAEVQAAAGLLTEEATIYLVLKNLGIGAPTPAAPPEASKAETFAERRARMEAELKNLGIGAPTPAASESPKAESFAERRARMEAEPDKSGTYLKADRVQVGDLVRITAVALEAAKTIDTARGPVDIPARPQVTGEFKAKGSKEWGQEVKFSLSKSNEKNLYKLWGKSLDECTGMVLMVASVQHKNIGGNDATWVEWTGLP